MSLFVLSEGFLLFLESLILRLGYLQGIDETIPYVLLHSAESRVFGACGVPCLPPINVLRKMQLAGALIPLNVTHNSILLHGALELVHVNPARTILHVAGI